MRLALFATLTLLSACDLPRDPGGTLDAVRDGVLRVGLIDPADRASVEAFATRLNARLQTQVGDAHDLAEALERGELDLIADLPASTPFRHIARSRPFGNKPERRIWAVRSGENAFLVEVNRHIAGEPLP